MRDPHRQARRVRSRRHGRPDLVLGAGFRHPRAGDGIPAEERVARDLLFDVPARVDPARARQHVVLMDLRQQRRGSARPGLVPRALSRRRSRGVARPRGRQSELRGTVPRRVGRDRRDIGRLHRVVPARPRAHDRADLLHSVAVPPAGRNRPGPVVRAAVLHAVVERYRHARAHWRIRLRDARRVRAGARPPASRNTGRRAVRGPH